MIDLQDTEQLLEYISSAPKSTPSVFFLKLNRRLDFPDCDVFGAGDCVVFGDFYSIERVLKENAEAGGKATLLCVCAQQRRSACRQGKF